MVHASPDEIRHFAGSVVAFRERCVDDLALLNTSLRDMSTVTPDPSLARYREAFLDGVSSLHLGLEELRVGERRLFALAASIEYLSLGVSGLARPSSTQASPSLSSTPNPTSTPIAGYRPGRGFQTRKDALPLTEIGAHALRDNIIWDDNFTESFWRARHHNHDAADYVALVSALPRVKSLLRRNQDPFKSKDDYVRKAYKAYFDEDTRVIIEKHPDGWRVTNGRHRIMASIAAGIPCLAQVQDMR